MQTTVRLKPLLPRLSARFLLSPLSRSYGTRRESKQWKQKPNRKAKLAVILKEDLPNRGSRGHVIQVEHGYGRNWLLPQGKAVYATPENLKLYVTEQKTAAGESESDIVAFLNDIFSRHDIAIPQSGADGADWAVYEHDVAKALRRFRLHVPLDCIHLEEPLTSFGEHPVLIRVDEKTEVPFTVMVVPSAKRDSKEEESRFPYS